MELLFIDESEQVKKDNKSHFVLLGTIVSSENLIPLERCLFKIKEKLKLENLKELRTSRKFTKEDRVKYSQELYDCLEDFNVTLLSSIIGTYSMNNASKTDNYYEAMTFIIERFYFYLHDRKKQGIIILDSNCEETTKQIRKRVYDYVLNEEKREGKIRKRIYGPIFFCEDEFSHVIQLSDLAVAGLQRATWEMLNTLEDSNNIKNNEDKLVNYSIFLKMYWKYFMKYKEKVSGSGIKYWN
jgi:hypothetical protein